MTLYATAQPFEDEVPLTKFDYVLRVILPDGQMFDLSAQKMAGGGLGLSVRTQNPGMSVFPEVSNAIVIHDAAPQFQVTRNCALIAAFKAAQTA